MEIKVSRPKQFADMSRDYHLLVDGKKIVSLKRGECQTVVVPEESTTIKAVIDWCSSPELSIKDIKGNEIVVKNSFADNLLLMLIASPYYITFGKNRYLKIEHAI